MNPLEAIGEDILHGIEWPFKHIAQFIKLIDKAVADEPAAKAAIIGLIQKGESVIKDSTAAGAAVAVAAASEGTNIPADTAALGDAKIVLSDAETFWQYFKGTFLPEVEAIFTDAEQIVEDPPAITTTTSITTTVA